MKRKKRTEGMKRRKRNQKNKTMQRATSERSLPPFLPGLFGLFSPFGPLALSQKRREVLAGVAALHGRDFLGRARRDDGTAA